MDYKARTEQVRRQLQMLFSVHLSSTEDEEAFASHIESFGRECAREALEELRDENIDSRPAVSLIVDAKIRQLMEQELGKEKEKT